MAHETYEVEDPTLVRRLPITSIMTQTPTANQVHIAAALTASPRNTSCSCVLG